MREQQNKQPEVPQMSLQFGKIERDKGLAQAVTHANEDSWGWSDKAYDLFKKWLAEKKVGDQFMIEDFRVDIFGKLEEPPSRRSFGGLTGKGVRDSLIEKAGYGQVKNVRAHATPVTIWKKK